MPPIAPQGSRTGLITGMVIAIIAGVTAIIFAIYFYVDANRTRDERDTVVKKYHGVLAEAALASSDISDLTARAQAPDAQQLGLTSNMTAMDIALKERDVLAERIAGAGANFDKALASSDAAAKAAAERMKGPGAATAASSNSLAGTVDSLATSLDQRQKEIAALTQQLDQAKKQVADTIAQMNANQQTLEKHLAEVRGQAEQASTGAQQYQQTKDQLTQQIQDTFAQQQKGLQDQLTAAQQQITQLTTELNKQKDAVVQLEGKLGQRRVPAAAPVVRQADGHIIRVTGAGTVYIDLGTGDQISNGLTFQVFDKNEGIPALPADASEDKPSNVGKGSIEVIRVGAGSSECRIVNTTPGQNIVVGDLIENLVYDRNTKYNFLVFGNFDLDQNGVATPQDADVVKRLITQWGGKVTDKVNADTDFVVLGKEPVIPVFTKEEQQDPINAAKLAEATAQAEAYENVKRQAIELHIPILNQNRFLYFIGYYELAKR
jgi:hypothetical protein